MKSRPLILVAAARRPLFKPVGEDANLVTFAAQTNLCRIGDDFATVTFNGIGTPWKCDSEK